MSLSVDNLSSYHTLQPAKHSNQHSLKELRALVINSILQSPKCFNIISWSSGKVVIEMPIRDGMIPAPVNNFLGTKNTRRVSASNSDEDTDRPPKFRTIRINRPLRRTASEFDKNRPIKGILKYPDGWKEKVYSKSTCDNVSVGTAIADSNSAGYRNNHDTMVGEISRSLQETALDSTSASDSSSGCNSENESNGFQSAHPKKSVHFNLSVTKATFRVDSALTRTKRNRNRSKRRAPIVNRKTETLSKEMGRPEVSNVKNDLNTAPTVASSITVTASSVNATEDSARSRRDSGYDSDLLSKGEDESVSDKSCPSDSGL